MPVDKKTLAVLALFSTSIIWGITLPLMKANLASIPPITLAFSRFLIAALIALSFSELKNLKIKDILHIGLFAFFGVTLNVSLFLIGLNQTNAVDATIILAISPIVTSFLATLTIHEKINPLHLLGILMAFLGSFIYILYPIFTNEASLKVDFRGDLLVLASVFCAAIYTIGSKKLFETYKPSSISAVSFLVGAVSFFPGAAFEYYQNPVWFTGLSLFNVVSIVFLGVVSSFIAYSALEWGLSKVPVHVDQTIAYLTPIISILIATAFLGEKIYWIFLFTAIFIGLGIYLVTKNRPQIHHHFHQRTHKM